MNRRVRTLARGDRGVGLVPPPRRLRAYRDPARRFPRRVLADLFAEHGYRCRNPLCDFGDLALEGHHVYAHALGGSSTAENAILLCRDCHACVHKGVLPIGLLIAWKRTPSTRDWQVFDSDELLSRIRAIPIALSGPARERLGALNQELLSVNALPSAVQRKHLYSEALLAKAAVLNDSTREYVGSLAHSRAARNWRYARVLRFGSAAAAFALTTGSGPSVLRGQHYRAVAYTAMGRPDRTLRALRRAAASAQQIMTAGSPRFHYLSTPGRIQQEIAITLARLGGDPERAKGEFRVSLGCCADGEESHAEAFRSVKLSLALSDSATAETTIRSLWDELSVLSCDDQLLLRRLTVEWHFARGARREAADLVGQGLSLARHTTRYREEFEFHALAARHQLHDL